MNSPLLNNYIQYLTRKGQVKTQSVTFVKNDINTTFEVSGIIEEYFILSVFENNIKKSGVGFENIDNIDMLAFINSNFFDINLIPQNQFLAPEQVVIMSYDNEYINTKSNVIFPDVQKVQNVAPDYRYIFHRDFTKTQIVNPDTVDLTLKQLIIPANSIKEGTILYFDIVSLSASIVSGSPSVICYISDDINNLKKVTMVSMVLNSSVTKPNFPQYYIPYSLGSFRLSRTDVTTNSYFTLDTTLPIYITFIANSISSVVGTFTMDSLSISRLG